MFEIKNLSMQIAVTLFYHHEQGILNLRSILYIPDGMACIFWTSDPKGDEKGG